MQESSGHGIQQRQSQLEDTELARAVSLSFKVSQSCHMLSFCFVVVVYFLFFHPSGSFYNLN